MRNQHFRTRFHGAVGLIACLGLVAGLLPAATPPVADAAPPLPDSPPAPSPQRAATLYLPLIVRDLSPSTYDLPPLPPGFTEPDGWAGQMAAAGAQAPDGDLIPGWHLLSVSVQPADTAPAAVLASIAGSYRLAYAYDGCDTADPWKVYDPAAPALGDLAAIDPKIGFWVAVTSTTALTVAGAPPGPTPIRLCRGWNLIGYPLGKPLPVLTALASIAGSFTRVFAYDPADPADPWSLFDVAVPGWVNDLQMLNEFWIDFYVNPVPPPVAVNQVWYDGRSAQGTVWAITNLRDPSQQPLLRSPRRAGARPAPTTALMISRRMPCSHKPNHVPAAPGRPSPPAASAC